MEQERSHRLIVKGGIWKSISIIIQRFGAEEVQDVMDQLKQQYNKSIVRQGYMAYFNKEQQRTTKQLLKKQKEEMTANGTVSFSVSKFPEERSDSG